MEQNQINPTSLERMFDELAEKNWASSLDLLPVEWIQSLAQKCQNFYSQGQFSSAAIGVGAQKTVVSHVRGDSTLWFEECDEVTRDEISRIFHPLMRDLNQNFYLGLKRFEAHFAIYPPGAGYDRHLDNHRGANSRRITFVCYLNEEWQPGHGGELTLFKPDSPTEVLEKITPDFGKVVLFRSEIFPHQVETSERPRRSLTGWLRDDAL